MFRAFIGLGSNLGRRRHNILSAWESLTRREDNRALALSSPYLSAPVGIQSEKWFINAVGIMATTSGPSQLLSGMLAIEAAMGRDRSQGDDRPVDLDLLYYDDLVLEEPSLTIPHPALADRLFVLLPLREVAPDHHHPLLGKTSSEMLHQLGAGEIVKKTSWDGE